MSVDAEWFINTTTLLRQSKRDGASGKCTVVYVGIVLEGGEMVVGRSFTILRSFFHEGDKYRSAVNKAGIISY
jgi:hypothetical protein